MENLCNNHQQMSIWENFRLRVPDKQQRRQETRKDKKALVAVEEPVEKPIKKPAARRQSTSVQIRDTPSVSVSKKKAPAKAERRKGIELLSETASLEEARLKKAIKRSKQETNIHQARGSSEGADLESEVLNEPKGKSIDINSDDGDDDDDQQSDDESTEFDDDKSANFIKTNDEGEDEFIHTPNYYVPTDDENVDDKEYECINKDMYDDVNVELKDAKPPNEEKGDEEMTHAENVNAEHKEVSQEVAADQVKDDAQATRLPLLHKRLKLHYKVLLSYPTMPLNFSTLITFLQQQSTPIPTPTTTEATTSTTAVPDSETLSAIHLRVSNLEKEVKELKNVDHTSALHVTIKSKVLVAVKEYLRTSLDDALYKEADDADRDKDPHTGPDQGLKRKKTGGSIDRTYTTSLTKTKAAKYNLPGIKDMVPNLWSPIKVAYDKHALLVTNVKLNVWYSYGHFEEIEVRRSNQQLYKFMEGEDIMYLAATLRMFIRRILIQKRVQDLELGVESYQKKLNISKPRIREEDLSRKAPYTTLSDPQGVIYEEKLNRKRLMRYDELYKFSVGTLQSVRDTLHDMANNLRMGYNKAMPKRRWGHLDMT
ncbi:hypothetical protein Tco_1034891 [Tanacetum coccineum]